MIDEKIEQTLAEIERNLKSVESARTMVDRTVEAIDQVPAGLAECVRELEEINAQIRQLLALVRDDYGRSTESFIAGQRKLIEMTAVEVRELKTRAAEINGSLFDEISRILDVSRQKLLELIRLVSDDTAKNISLYADSQKELVASAARAVAELEKTPERLSAEMTKRAEELSDRCSRIVSEAIAASFREYSEGLESLKKELLENAALSDRDLIRTVSGDIADSREKIAGTVEENRKSLSAEVRDIIAEGTETLSRKHGSLRQQLVSDAFSLKQTMTEENENIRKHLARMKIMLAANAALMAIILGVLLFR
ncbi:MAG: hypothetical protein IJ523_05340 [Succinivibrionaceae bacterium]|nr:hypothetical protein [Succinivibrionaceae bacterium]